MSGEPVIYTIGHSNHPLDHFLGLLKEHDIQLVADVRSRPYSRYVPQFNRPNLAADLERVNIRYRFLGRELGGKPPDRGRSRTGELVFAHLRSQPQFRLGVNRLLEEARGARVCVLCAEADPARCHRGLLLAPELTARGAKVRHILADGRLLDQEDLEPPPKLEQKRLF